MRLFDWRHRVDLGSELQEIYLHRFLLKLALGTVAIFVPLYLLDLGYALYMVPVFYAAFYGTFIVGAFPAAQLTARVGYKRGALLASPLLLLFYLALRSFTAPTLLVLPVAVLGGIGFVLYWMGMNAEMATSSHDGERETAAGYFFSMPQLAEVVAPLVGGLVIAVAGFDTLFLLAAALIALSYTPFLFSREHYAGMDAPTRRFLGRDYAAAFLVFAARGAAGLARKIVWPLYLATIVGAVTIGSAGSILGLGGAAASIVIGRVTTPDTAPRVMQLGGLATAAAVLLMPLVTTGLGAVTVAGVAGIALVGLTLPLYGRTMAAAEADDMLGYVAFREVALCSGRVILLGLLVAGFLAAPRSAFVLGFGLLAVASVAAGFTGHVIGDRHR